MENLIVYLIKSATLLLLFYSTYYFLLKKNTFFTTNRWFLLLGLFCAAFLPLLTFQKTVWVEPVISSIDTTNFEVISENGMDNLPLPVEENFLISWEMVVGLLYGIGVLVFLTQLLVEFYSLRKIIKSKSKIKVDGFELIEVEEAISPFSFFNKIVYNRSLFQPEELLNIIEHEKIHAKQLHSLDVLIARIYCILFWWNPVVWFYKKAIVQNLEFIADHNALAKAKDKKSYLLTLLKITTAEKHVAITNHFYQSLIKKRIVMLHTNQSKKHHSWNYFIVLPALVFFMLTYQVEVVAQEKTTITVSENQKLALIELQIEAQTTDKELKEASVLFNQEFGITLEYSKLKRNKKGEIIAIKVALKDKNSKSDIKTEYEVLGNTPIKSFKVFVGADTNGKVEFGYGEREQSHLVNLQVVENEAIFYETTVEEEANTALVSKIAEIQTPPNPPTPPNYPTPPIVPNFPTPPVVPDVPNNENNKEIWTNFLKEMETFKKEMDSDEMKKFIRETQDYSKELASLENESSEFQKEMKEFQIIITEFNNLILNKNEIQSMNKSAQNDREQAWAARKKAFYERQNIFDKRKKMVDERKKLVDERKKTKEKAIKEISNQN